MARESHELTSQPCAALAEIRDSLLETYASNDAMNQLILSRLDPCAWRAQPPGQKGHGRTIATLFAHLHNSRLTWLRLSAPHLKCPPPVDPERCTMKQAAAAHKKSAAQCLPMLTEPLSGAPPWRAVQVARLLAHEALLEHPLIAEPWVWDIGRAEPKNIFQRLAHFVKSEVDANPLQQFDQCVRAFGKYRLRRRAFLVQAM